MLIVVGTALVAARMGKRARVAEVSKGGMECERGWTVGPGLEPAGCRGHDESWGAMEDFQQVMRCRGLPLAPTLSLDL